MSITRFDVCRVPGSRMTHKYDAVNQAEIDKAMKKMAVAFKAARG